jgi:DNA-binding NtrC family response regulator
VRILLVEDDPGQLLCLRKGLSRLGHEVICTMDGDCAFGSWRIQRPFGAVVLESRFQGKRVWNGFELIAAIRAIDPLQAFVMQTGDENLVPPSGVPVIYKPYSFRRLLRRLEPTAQASLPLGC